MTSGFLRRLAGMQSGELTFRFETELRKASSRLRSALVRPQWDRAQLASVLRPDGATSPAWTSAYAALQKRDYHAAHVALGAHFSQRISAFPLTAARVFTVADAIVRDFPDASAASTRRAEALLRGEYDLLGYRGLQIGSSPDWHRDPVHGRRSPMVFWSSVPYLDAAAGDHKIIWELNRHQHWLAFGRAYALSRERRFYDAFTSQLTSWLGANPPRMGINWASMLELAFRSLSWLWALELFAVAAGPEDRDPWLVDLLLALDLQLTHIEHNLSYYFSPNTHLSGEGLALYVAGLALPELKGSARRAATGRSVLVSEAARQIRSDGGHAEQSAHYHRYSTDFYLLASATAQNAVDPSSQVFEEVARSQARFLRTISDDRGRRPQIGDDDSGQLFPMCGREPDDCRDTLATAAVLLNEPSLAVDRVPEESYWICGPDACRGMPRENARWSSAALPASGCVVSRSARGDHLIFDAGPHGFLNGGHAHADALSCVLSVGGLPVLIDPGTAVYTMDAEIRDRFRSASMHNTLVLNGRSQSEPRGPFHWSSTTDSHLPIWRSGGDCDYAEGTHAAYLPNRHTRTILAVHGLGWWVVDHVLGSGATDVEINWHVHPRWTCRLGGPRTASLSTEDATLAIASTAPLTIVPPGTHRLAVWSPAYGVIEPAPVVTARKTASLPITIASFIPATGELADALHIEEVVLDATPGNGWHSSAFRVRWNAGTMTWLGAIETSGLASDDSASPRSQWGTAEFHTDARIALLLDRVGGASEVILVNGTLARAHNHQSVSLASRVPLRRFAVTSRARNMHEVGASVRSDLSPAER